MVVRILRGIGSPGKLWTGDAPEGGVIADVALVERHCSSEGCGRSTRKLKARAATLSAEAISALEIPTLLVTMGGVGSLHTSDSAESLVCWNWSGRRGGHAILAPVAPLTGYHPREELPPPRPGYVWLQTYAGSTLSEFVLLAEDERRHTLLPVIRLEGTCPPRREARGGVEQSPDPSKEELIEIA